MTVQEQSNARSFPSPDLKSSVCACVFMCSWMHPFLCVSVYVRRECLQRCQWRFKIFSLLSAPTHFSLCTAAQICKSSLLRMQSTRSASIYSILLSPCFCTHPPSLFISALCPPPHPSAASILPLVFCLVLAALFMAYAPSEELYGGERFSTEYLQHRGSAKTRSILSI